MTASTGGQASLIGTTLGEYEVQALIGRGAMATVYLARDVKLNRKVALKVLLGSLARNEEDVKRFHLEAQAAAPLRHPNIVRVYSAGVERRTPYIAMEYVEGETLDRFLRRKGRVNWVNALFIAEQIALALAVAHKNGIVHRDIKPGNIILDRSGQVRLMDFGIANVQSAAGGGAHSGLFGTPQYMAPEQFTKNESSPKSDLFSLGVLLYQLISGKLPFEGESSMALIKSITHDEPERLNKSVMDVPDDAARLVAYLLEKEPRRRPASARVVTTLIQRVQEQKGGSSAVPEALTQFIKEQAQPSEIKGLTPAPARRPTTGFRKKDGAKKASAFSLKRYGFAGLVAIFAIAAFTFFPVTTQRAKSATPEIARPLNSALFRDLQNRAVEFSLLNDDLRCTDIEWVGNRDVLVARFEGRPGTLFHGAIGIAAIDINARESYALQPPRSPALDMHYVETVVPSQWALHAIPHLPDSSPLSKTLLMSAYEDGVRGRSDDIVLLAQRWDRERPNPAIVYRYPIAKESGNWADGYLDRTLPFVAIHPKNNVAAFVVYDSLQNAHTVVERDFPPATKGATERALTTALTRLIPTSVQYTPDGAGLVYARRIGQESNEVWYYDRHDAKLNGRLIVDNAIGAQGGLSTDGSYLAWRSSPDQIGIYEASTGNLAATIAGTGVSESAWHPFGRYLLVANVDADSDGDQIWAVRLNSEDAPRRLTNFVGGVDRGRYAVSRGGTWLAAVSDRDGLSRIVFSDLSGLQ